jgi:hypothetical protein
MLDAEDFFILEIEPVTDWLSITMHRDLGTDEAHAQLLAIALQETKLTSRAQIIEPYGCPITTRPAHGWYQFEGNKNQALDLVMRNPATIDAVHQACDYQGVEMALDHVWWAVYGNDWLATVMARLLLWLDPHPLPKLGNEQEAWDLYIRCWQPGKPHPETWAENYAEAVDVIRDGVPLGA